MLKSDLLEIIANGENSGVEFKRDDIRPEQLAKEIVAFANVQGGRILLGVEDNGRITGLHRAGPPGVGFECVPGQGTSPDYPLLRGSRR